MKKSLFAIVVLLSTVVCVTPNLDTENFVREQPAAEDLVGTYEPIGSSRKMIQEEGEYEPWDISVKLMANGSFEISGMPDWWWHPLGEASGGFGSGSGEWEIVSHQPWWDVQFNFDTGDIPIGLTSVPIAGEAPSYRLWFYLGDPDSGRAMIFERMDS